MTEGGLILPAGADGVGLNWWTDHLLPLTEQFAKAADGDEDHDFWSNIYKVSGGSGGPFITGGILNLFPYMDGRNELIQNPWLGGGKTGNIFHLATRDDFPASISSVPFEWEYYTEKFPMVITSGLVGVMQDQDVMNVRPEMGWAIMDEVKSPEG